MRISPRTVLRTLTGAAILGFGVLAFSPAPAEAHGYWRNPGYGHGYGYGYRPYWAPRPAFAPRYYAPRPYYYAPPRVAYLPPPAYYAPRPYGGYYTGW